VNHSPGDCKLTTPSSNISSLLRNLTPQELICSLHSFSALLLTDAGILTPHRVESRAFELVFTLNDITYASD
jgi:hypothetical protein